MSAHCFTVSHEQLVRQLRSPIGIAPYFCADGTINKNHPQQLGYQAIWDTGATNTCVSSRIAETMEFQKVGEQPMQTPAGNCIKNLYALNVYLPNGVMFENVPVIEAEMADFDILIGMDILSRGDFIVSNFERKTKFTFRLPSLHGYDFVKSKYLTVEKAQQEVKRNEACPCGSGKKYKNCHGR